MIRIAIFFKGLRLFKVSYRILEWLKVNVERMYVFAKTSRFAQFTLVSKDHLTPSTKEFWCKQLSKDSLSAVNEDISGLVSIWLHILTFCLTRTLEIWKNIGSPFRVHIAWEDDTNSTELYKRLSCVGGVSSGDVSTGWISESTKESWHYQKNVVTSVSSSLLYVHGCTSRSA